jgi:hypothetical protein
MQTGRGGSVQFTLSIREGFGSALLLNSGEFLREGLISTYEITLAVEDLWYCG